MQAMGATAGMGAPGFPPGAAGAMPPPAAVTQQPQRPQVTMAQLQQILNSGAPLAGFQSSLLNQSSSDEDK